MNSRRLACVVAGSVTLTACYATRTVAPPYPDSRLEIAFVTPRDIAEQDSAGHVVAEYHAVAGISGRIAAAAGDTLVIEPAAYRSPDGGVFPRPSPGTHVMLVNVPARITRQEPNDLAKVGVAAAVGVAAMFLILVLFYHPRGDVVI